MTTIRDRDIAAWLEAFSAAVRAQDFAAGRALFAAETTGFGTVAARYDDLDDLVATQWSEVWGRTEEFAFDDVRTTWSDASLCAVAATWHSLGAGGRTRTGRATLVLRPADGPGLVAVHSHFSMTPGTPA